jgi:branched-chain amino acid transport system ATP-binding protein
VAILEIRGLVKHFGGLAAINGVELDVNQGEILGLIGPNGAGKTTMFNLITGTFRPTAGSIVFKGENLVGLRPYQIAARGLVRTFQSTNLFSEVTVRQNVITAFHMEANVSFWGAVFGGKAVNTREKNIIKKTDELLEFFGLTHLQNELASTLPHGHQRRLGVAVALATSPKLILLDEPVTGMNPEETREMMVTIRKVRDSGITVLVVEHDMKAVMGMCDRIAVLDYGQKIAEGDPKEIQENKAVIRAYLGERRRAA